MRLLWLAHDIQEQILFSVSPTRRDVVTSRERSGVQSQEEQALT
jgi:hypothetical protein